MFKQFVGISALVVASLSASGLSAFVDQPTNEGVYIQGFGGANWVDAKSLDLKTGFTVAGAAGYKFETGTRLEGEVSYRNNKVDIPAVNVTFEDVAVMGNLYQDIPLGDLPVTPYVGGGLGHTWAKGKVQGTSIAKDDGFAWQVMGGLNYDVSEKTELGLEYRFVHLGENICDHSVGLVARRFF